MNIGETKMKIMLSAVAGALLLLLATSPQPTVASKAPSGATLDPLAARQLILRLSVLVGLSDPIAGDMWLGSGTMIDDDTIISAGHLESFRLSSYRDSYYIASGSDSRWVVAKWSYNPDLLLLKRSPITPGPTKALWAGLGERLVDGEEVYSCGFPGVFDKWITSGFVHNQSIRQVQHDEQLWCGSYQGIPGNSGSGVFNLRGQLVGVHVEGWSDSRGNSVAFMKYFVCLGAIKKFLEGELD